MKTSKDKDFDAVEYMRKQRRILSNKLLKMTREEIVEYFKKRRSISVKPCG